MRHKQEIHKMCTIFNILNICHIYSTKYIKLEQKQQGFREMMSCATKGMG